MKWRYLNYSNAVDTQFTSLTTIVFGQSSGWDTRYNWCFTVETCQWYQQPSGHWHQSNQHWRTQEKWVAHRAGLAGTTRKRMAIASESNLCIRWREYTLISLHDTGWRKESCHSIGTINFHRLVYTVAYVQRALNKHKPATLVVSIEEREKAKATIFKLLQQEHFGEEMKSLRAGKKIPKSSKILQFSLVLDEEGLIRAKGRIGKS